MPSDVNFGILKPIQPDAKVIASGTSSSGIKGDVGQGFASTVDALTNMKNSNQTRDENAQLFPDKLANSHMAEKQNELILANEQDARQYQISKSAAAALGPDKYFKALSPDDQQAYLLKQNQINKGISDIASEDAKTDAQKLTNMQHLTVQMASLASAAVNAAHANDKGTPGVQQISPGGPNAMLPPNAGTPQQGQTAPQQPSTGQLGPIKPQAPTQPGMPPQQQASQLAPINPNQSQQNLQQSNNQQSIQNANKIVQFAMANLPPTQQKALNVVFPNGQYDEQGAMALVRAGTAIHLQQKEEAEDKNSTLQLMDAATTIQKRIQAAGSNADPVDVKNLAALNAKIVDDHNKGQGNDPSASVQKPMDMNDAKNAASADLSQTPLKSFKESIMGMNQLLAAIPKGYVGPLTDASKINLTSSGIQDIQHFQAKMGYLAKTVIANQSQGMRLTTAELTQLNKIVSGTNNNWDSIKDIMKDMNKEVNTKSHDAWALSNRVRSGGDADKYKTWQQTNPEPYDPDKTYQHKGKDVPSDAMDRAMDANPGKDEKWVIAHYGLTPKGQ